MITEEILSAAMAQSAEDIGCGAEDFRKNSNMLVPFHLGERARKYLKLPISANFVSYGNNVVAAVTEELWDIAEEYVGKFPCERLFETPNMHWLGDRILERGHRVCFMAEYFLPDLSRLRPRSCDFALRLLEPADFQDLYTPEWGNALCGDRKHLDVLAVGAFDGENLVGLAGCSADCAEMWQIGVDVLPEYRRKGIASAVTSTLAAETLRRGKVLFYCCAWSNVRSARNAIRSGFVPAWVEMTVKPKEIVDGMNGEAR